VPTDHLEHLVLEDRIHGSVYTDPTIFALEMRRLFERCWVYVAHESEVAEGGDYKTTTIGQQPVIVARDSDSGDIFVMLNRCRHRAATVCQAEQGSANYFRCAYHGWTYNNRGELIGVTFPEGYGPDFNARALGLIRAPRVESYRGFIFASLAPDGPSLIEHLGNAAPYLDQIADQGPHGIEARSGVQRQGYNGNWKLGLENAVDNYHVSFVHKSFVDILAHRTGSRGKWHAGVCRDLGNGHGTLEFGQGANATGGLAFNLVVFPNLAFVGTQIRVIRPITVERTELVIYPTLLRDAPPEVNAERLRVHEESFGPAGFVSPDDVEVSLERLQRGLKATVDNEWLLLSRGLTRQEVDNRGVRTSHISDELGQQAIFREWKRLMVVA
jgi:phenylpropionate dioxygenase-like ring-hydroxylating dioxygenase large terminal subunit